VKKDSFPVWIQLMVGTGFVDRVLNVENDKQITD
jgi:hypothetical protein